MTGGTNSELDNARSEGREGRDENAGRVCAGRTWWRMVAAWTTDEDAMNGGEGAKEGVDDKLRRRFRGEGNVPGEVAKGEPGVTSMELEGAGAE